MTIRPQSFPLLLALLLGSACAGISAPQEQARSTPANPAERLLELSQSDNRAMQHLRHLTKEIGPRLTGSEHYDRAAQWCVEQFRAWGLDAHLETFGELPLRFDRGPQRGREIAPKTHDLVFQTRSWTRGTQGAVRARCVFEPESAEELTAHEKDYAGAWIVRRARRPRAELRKAIEALLEKTPPAGILSGGGEQLVMSGNPRRPLAELMARPVEIVLRRDHYDEIVASLSAGTAVELEFEIENHIVEGPVACTNVVADLVGSEFPDEYVIVGAHLDSWDGAEGAQDNGTGVCSTLEAARLIASLGVKPRRTLRFVLFGGEEQGLLGSEGYVKTHAQELPRVSAVLVHDGGENPIQGLDVTYAMYADVARVLAPLAALDRDRPVAVHEVMGLLNSEDSDHAPFLHEARAPAFFWNQSETGYELVHHTQLDTFATVSGPDEEHNARVVAVAAFGLAQLDHALDRTDSEALPTRKMGVAGFQDTAVRSVLPEGRAQQAGWQDGDVLLSVDGVAVSGRESLVRAINQGGPRKTIRLRRGATELDTVLDWSDDPDEPERSARAGRREAWLKAHPRP
ncbi:MAG: M20/M25/M40 family metallo-hydrolase [Planctomycetes bacterium]|nr:M20/M25/M40 family metallo-hydrolase [Planctomycetota bacterium]